MLVSSLIATMSLLFATVPAADAYGPEQWANWLLFQL